MSLLHAQVLEADACVLALGVRGLQGVVAQSPALAKRCPEVAAASGLGGIDVMAVRLWLDRYVPTDAPSNVFGRLEGLRGAGGTFFMLDQLQPDQAALWGGAEPQGSVLACDFYNASALLGLSNEDVVQLLMRELLPTAIPGVCGAAGAFCGRGHVAPPPPPPPTARPPFRALRRGRGFALYTSIAVRILHVLVPRPATMKQRQWANAAKRHQISTQPVCSMRTAHALRHHYPCPPPPPPHIVCRCNWSSVVGLGFGGAVATLCHQNRSPCI